MVVLYTRIYQELLENVWIDMWCCSSRICAISLRTGNISLLYRPNPPPLHSAPCIFLDVTPQKDVSPIFVSIITLREGFIMDIYAVLA